jgi:hypothetical protein
MLRNNPTSDQGLLFLESRAEGPASKSSYFLGDPPPDPRFLASLGTLPPVEHDHRCVVDRASYVTGRAPSSLALTSRGLMSTVND